MRISVRQATPEDADWLIEQLKAFAAFMNTKRSLFGDESLVRTNLDIMIRTHIILLAERKADGVRLGFIGGMYIPHVFNPEIRLLSELFWWVAPEHRGSRAGLLLLNAFVEFGKENADWVSVSLEQQSQVDERCLTKRGFRLFEKHYLLEVA